MVADSDGLRPRLTTLDLVGEYCRKRFGSLVQEGFWVVCLDGAQAPIQIVQVSQGTGNLQALSPADVLRPVLLSGSTSYLVVHNHPSGTTEPSADDWESTRVLQTLSATMCLDLVDHIIVTRADWQNLRQIDTRGIWGKGNTVRPRKPEPSRRVSGSLRVG
jgi:DNA repair protein RadC